MKWRVYYRGGTTFDSSQGTECEAPGVGVLGIVFPNNTGNSTVLKGWDWYYYRTDLSQWWGSDIHGLLYQLTEDPVGAVQAVKQGVMVSNDEYARFSKAAAFDPDFPRPTRHKMDEPLTHKGTPNE